MDIYFHGFWRMDWGLGNPNKTAALIATLMIAVWALAYIRKWGFWIALGLFTGLGICLIHTFSRGGMVALGAGLLPLLWQAPRPWPWKQIAATAAAVWIMTGVSVFLQADNRYLQGLIKEDRSITHRLEIWEKTPRMMVDAPSGWGLGEASKAYMQWYQPLERNEVYLNLINSHLTWLVEIGWGWRFLYLFGWLAAFVLCWRGKDSRWFSIPLGIWLAFFVAGIFTHVADSPWLWILPAGSLAAVLASRIRHRVWPRRVAWLAIAAVPVILLAVIHGLGGTLRELEIRCSSHDVIIGSKQPGTWIVVNPTVMGEGYAKTLRRYLQSPTEQTSLGIVARLDELKNKQEDVRQSVTSTVVVAGSLANPDIAKLKEFKNIILLNPAFFPQEIDFNKTKFVSVYFGEFSQSPAFQSWCDLGVVHTVEGSGDFLANWPELVFNPSPHQ